MHRLPKMILVSLLIFPVLIGNPAAGADLNRKPLVDVYAAVHAPPADNPPTETISADTSRSLLNLGYGIEFWKKGRPYLGIALADSLAELPVDFQGLDIGPQDYQLSPLLVLFLPLEECAEHPHGRFRLYGGIGPGVSLVQKEPFDMAGRYTMDIGVDLRFGLLWAF